MNEQSSEELLSISALQSFKTPANSPKKLLNNRHMRANRQSDWMNRM